MAALGHGDVVIIPAADRLSRSTFDLFGIVKQKPDDRREALKGQNIDLANTSK
jgi:hypothetical protein